MIKTMIKLAGLSMATVFLATDVMANEFQIEAKMPTFEPVKNVEPVYPQRALERKISGYTLVEYTINEDGRSENVKVVDAEPSNVFNTASKRAVSRTVYDKEDAAGAAGTTFYRLYVYELDDTNANKLALAGRH